MAISYPLYDLLLKKVEERTEKNVDIRCVCTTINNITRTLTPSDANDHFCEIYALILHHEAINNNGVLLSATPYNPKIVDDDRRGILNFIMNLPPLLQQIITQYIFEYSEKVS
jgi:hypothetical protein